MVHFAAFIRPPDLCRVTLPLFNLSYAFWMLYNVTDKVLTSTCRMLYNFLLDFQLLAIFSSIPTTKLSKAAILVTVIFSRNRSWKETAPKCLLDDDDVELIVLRCRVDILEANCDQCVCMVQCCFTSTETIRLIRTGSPGRPPRLSHSSWTLRNAYLFAVKGLWQTSSTGLRHLSSLDARSVVCSCQPHMVTPGRTNSTTSQYTFQFLLMFSTALNLGR